MPPETHVLKNKTIKRMRNEITTLTFCGIAIEKVNAENEDSVQLL
jgi:hypothetical protein